MSDELCSCGADATIRFTSTAIEEGEVLDEVVLCNDCASTEVTGQLSTLIPTQKEE